MKIHKNLFSEIEKAFKHAPIESGGILGSKDHIICAFFFDPSPQQHTSEYIPNIGILNQVIADWERQNISFAGIIHSHPNGAAGLSCADMEYGNIIITKYPRLKKDFFLPLVLYEPNFHILSYAKKRKRWTKDKITLI